MNFDGFTTVDFPPKNHDLPGFVYALCWVTESEEVPFYVGQTSRIWGRLDDYYWATLSAPTDFRVGEAVRHMGANGYQVVVKYKRVADSRSCERDLIAEIHECRGTNSLLNDLKGFDWTNADGPKERLRVQECIDRLLRSEPASD